MSRGLKWDGAKLMLGDLLIGEVVEANGMSGPKARWWLSGHNIAGSVTEGVDLRMRNQLARKQCWDAAISALAQVGLELNP